MLAQSIAVASHFHSVVFASFVCNKQLTCAAALCNTLVGLVAIVLTVVWAWMIKELTSYGARVAHLHYKG